MSFVSVLRRLRIAGALVAVHGLGMASTGWAAPVPIFTTKSGTITAGEQGVLHLHLERLPSEEVRAAFLQKLVEASAGDNPPWMLDYCRLNIRAHKPPQRKARA